MIVEIDGFYHRAHLIGRNCSKQQLEHMYKETKENSLDQSKLIEVFCRLHHFKQIAYSEYRKVDFVLDMDTDRIYSPSY